MQDVAYGNEPAIGVWGDSAAGIARARGLAETAGGRVALAAGIEQCEALRDRALDAVLIDITHDGGPALDALLDEVNAQAAADRLRGVVSVPFDLVDVAAARVTHGDVALVCQGSDAECVAELALALVPPDPFLFEERGDDSSLQLRRMRTEISRLARALATVAGAADERPPAGFVPPEAPQPVMVEQPGAAVVRTMIRTRRLREQFFDPELFADPAWDMLLDLMLARLEGRSVAVSSLCIAAAVPPTTALRWINRLTEEGLFSRIADPLDRRRVFIELSETCAAAMARYLKATAPPQHAAA